MHSDYMSARTLVSILAYHEWRAKKHAFKQSVYADGTPEACVALGAASECDETIRQLRNTIDREARAYSPGN